MTPSAAQAQGYERISKYPKSTKYGRQNPITERWNSDEQLVLWRHGMGGCDQSSFGAHLGTKNASTTAAMLSVACWSGLRSMRDVVARAMDKKGIISDRCELNRQIKADNALLRELKAEIKKLAALVARTVPAIAEGLEKLRSRVLIFCYQLSHIRNGKSHIQKSLAVWKPELERYTGLVQQIQGKRARNAKHWLPRKRHCQYTM